MYRIKNTADDRSKSLLHRKAAKFELEPNLGGHRIRLGTHHDISDEHYERVKSIVQEWVTRGMVEVTQLNAGEDGKPAKEGPKLDAKGNKLGGPTLEEFVQKGYPADKYPPHGWAEVPSEGLVALRKQQDAAAAQLAQEEAAKAVAAKQTEPADLVAADTASMSRETVPLPTVAQPPAPASTPASPTEDRLEKKSSGKKKLF